MISQRYKVGWRPWVPVLLFLVYWIVALLIYHFGLILYPPMHLKTYGYLFFSFLFFVVGYKIGLGFLYRRTSKEIALFSAGNTYILVLLKVVTVMSLIGIIGLIADRFISGSGTISKTLNDVETVRGEIALTPITTISNFFYLPFLVAFALYMYCFVVHWELPRWVHLSIYSIVFLSCFIAFLGTERQALLYVGEYLWFFLFFALDKRLSSVLFNRSFRKFRVIVFVIMVISVAYFFFIARYRAGDNYLANFRARLGQQDRYELFKDNDYGAMFLFSSYMTDSINITDTVCGEAEPIAFNPGLIMGERVLFQIKRFYPDYEPDALRIVDELNETLGDNTWRYKWWSMFGYNLIMFGYVGNLFFMGILGVVFGHMVRHFILYCNVGSFIIVFCLFLSLTASYESFFVEIFHTAGYFTGFVIYLINIFSYPSVNSLTNRNRRKILNESPIG